MRKVELREALTLKLSPAQRQAIEELAEQEDMTLGNACRIFISAGIEVLKIG